MGIQYMVLDTVSEAEAKFQKGDKFDARLQVDAADPDRQRAFDYTRDMAQYSTFLSPSTRGTSPSTYLEGSGSTSPSSHMMGQGQREPSQHPQLATYQSGPEDYMYDADTSPQGSHYGADYQEAGGNDGRRSETRWSSRHHARTCTHSRHYTGQRGSRGSSENACNLLPPS